MEYTKEQITEVVKEAIIDTVGPDFNAESHKSMKNDLGMDSLDIMDMTIKIETSLGIALNGDVVNKLDTVGELEQYIFEISNGD